MARKTIKDLEEQLKSAWNLNNAYFDDIEKLRKEIEDIKNDKNVISVIEVKRLEREIETLKLKARAEEDRAERWKLRYDELVGKYKAKNIRGAGRKMFDDELIIKKIYDLYLSGKSLKNIADDLNNDSAEIKNWSKSTVRFILLNKKNISLGFIDDDTYNNALEMLGNNRKNIKNKD